MALPRVLIVGAGIAGLALARTLRSAGVDFDVIDRRDVTDSPGAALLLTGNAVRALMTLGLDAAVIKMSRPVTSMRFTDQRQRLLFEVDVAARPQWGTFLSIERAVLQDVLLEHEGPITPSWATTIVALRQGADGVEIHRSDGIMDRYDVIVGADGVHSQVRQMAFGAPSLEPMPGYYGWRFLAACPQGLERPQYMLGNGCTLLLHPLRDGKVYCGAGPVSVDLLRGHSDVERLRAAFAEFEGFAAEVVARIDDRTPLIATRYWNVEQPSWRREGCVLVGDAAHACAPTLAQGAAMALEDALVLGRLLGEKGTAAAMQEYEARRRPRVMHAQSHSLERMAVNRVTSERAVMLRNAVLARAGETQFLDALAPLMEGSP